MRIKVTWEMSCAAAEKAVKKAGGDPRDAHDVQCLINRSRFSENVPSGALLLDKQAEGYRVVSVSIVGGES